MSTDSSKQQIDPVDTSTASTNRSSIEDNPHFVDALCSPSDSDDQKAPFWREAWYPVCFAADFPSEKPYAFSVYDRGFVLFRNESKQIVCLEDKCPHRVAKLSDGSLCDGKIECLYHGWKFAGTGECVEIPQLMPDTKIPSRSTVASFPVIESQGIVWMWASREAKPDETSIPLVPATEQENVHFIDFQMDLPYDQTYLIENVIDIAHIHIAHHGVKGGGHRAHAKPLDFEVLEESAAGIVARFKTVGFENKNTATRLKDARVYYRAPNTIEYQSDFVDSSRISGLVLYCVPLGKERCRLLYRAYNNFADQRERSRPRWKEHLNQVHLLEQDMAVVTGQYEQIERDSRPLKEQWLPIHSSDLLVIKYRQWLDRYGDGIPFFVGWKNRKTREVSAEKLKSNRMTLHTRICRSCQEAHEQLQRNQFRFLVSGIVAIGAAAAISNLLISSAIVGVGGILFGLSYRAARLKKSLE